MRKTRCKKVKVCYNGVFDGNSYCTFGAPEDMWKYVGSTVKISENEVYSLKGKFLGKINFPAHQDCIAVSSH